VVVRVVEKKMICAGERTTFSSIQIFDDEYSFEVWCWRRTEKISWTICVRNEEVLNRAEEGRNVFHAIKRGKANCIGHIFRRNWLLKHGVEGKI